MTAPVPVTTLQMQAPSALIDRLDAQVVREGGRLEWPNCPARQALIARACTEYLERHERDTQAGRPDA